MRKTLAVIASLLFFVAFGFAEESYDIPEEKPDSARQPRGKRSIKQKTASEQRQMPAL